MSQNIPFGKNVLIRARDSGQSEFFHRIKSEFNQTQTVGTILSFGPAVPEDYFKPYKLEELIGKIVYFPAFQEVQTNADPDQPEILINYENIRGFNDGK